MNYEIENSNENLKNKEFFLSFNTVFSKNERIFLNFLIEKFFETNSSISEIDTNFFEAEFKIESKSIYSFLEKLSKKSITYSYFNGSEVISGTFNMISSFFIKSNSVTIFLPQELSDTSTLLPLNLKELYTFKDKNSFIFYSHFFKYFFSKKDFEVEFEELKKILKLENKYERFFDFEKNVIKHLLEDFHNYFALNCEKIKTGQNINNKVIGFKFFFKDEKNLRLKSLIFLLKNDITNLDEVNKLIGNAIEKLGYEATSKKCFWAKKNWRSSGTSFEEFLKKLISAIE